MSYDSQEKIAERVKELIYHDSDYDHTLFENFSQDVYSATIEQANSIEEYLRNKDFEKLGRLLWCLSVTSREELAKAQAQRDFEDGNL